MSVSGGRELLIRQIADEMAARITTTTHGGTRVREFWSKAALEALDRLGFEVIPASTLEADRRILDAAEALAELVPEVGPVEDWSAVSAREDVLLNAIRARRWVSDV